MPRAHVTGVTDNGAWMHTLATRGFVSLYTEKGKTAARQPEIFDKSVDSGWWIEMVTPTLAAFLAGCPIEGNRGS